MTPGGGSDDPAGAGVPVPAQYSGTRMPPSQSSNLPPRNGVLLPGARPLSPVYRIRLPGRVAARTVAVA